jgi:hypothetical protein
VKTEMVNSARIGTRREIVLKGGLILLPLLFLEAARAANGAVFFWPDFFVRSGWVISILLLAWLGKLIIRETGTKIFPYRSFILPGLLLLTTLIYWISGTTWAAWLLCGVVWSLLLVATDLSSRKWRWPATVALSGIAGLLPVVIAQIETRFSDEEFFVLVEVAHLALFWLLLSLVWKGVFPAKNKLNAVNGVSIPIKAFVVIAGLLGIMGMIGTMRAYQMSFYTNSAPTYPGISEANPFLCGQVEGDDTIYSGEEVFQRALERVMANPLKEPPDLALLALGTKEDGWLEAYKASLLQEARSDAFTQPAHSIKYGQYQAALRIYYYNVMLQAYPHLFTAQEENLLQTWFAAINRRAQTVEWVDWMYAIAFRMLPKGPYENQETGAGLLSLLEAQNLADTGLSDANQAYLAERGGGWEAGFRNTDDAIIYQPEWINNAYFQSIYTGSLSLENAQRSFEWLLLQSPPDGSPLSYNHIGMVHLVAPAYLGAQTVQDERLLWLAGRSVDYLVTNDQPISARPGMEQILGGVGTSPTTGTCLIYGSSGVPTRRGPLAPDKVVFRDGWDEDASYLLLNLRFTGWHRYKATNAIVLVSKSGPLVTENATGQTFAWLPSGRSLFRDKRIPRENLNGLVIRRSGLNAIVYELTGVGSLWAQDPPAYAHLESFKTQPGYDYTSSVIDDWHGWKHQRDIHFFHQGPIVVVDTATGRVKDRPALIWHTTSSNSLIQNRLIIREGSDPAEMVLIPLEAGEFSTNYIENSAQQELRVEFQPSQNRDLALATVFLTGNWVSAQVNLFDVDGQPTIQITSSDDEILLPIQVKTDE